jgi:predicted aldo/keto reductase-like oxidoreductase
MILGKTGIETIKNGFGALPIQRIGVEESTKILLRAYESGITFYDTARFYTDSEEKIGIALGNVRHNITIASKTMAKTKEEFQKDLETTLRELKTDYVDLYQFHNPPFCPKPDDGTGLYEEMLKAKEKGYIRHIGITNHRIKVAKEAIESNLYDTLQFPFSYLASDSEMELVNECIDNNMGFIAMKALAGGLIQNSAAAFAFMMQYDVLPIWGIQKLEELEEFVSYIDQPPKYEEYTHIIEKDRDILTGNFCRGCGYCLPCPSNIDIPNCARMSLMIRRAPTTVYMSKDWIDKMKAIEVCTECNSCKERCPYGLDSPNLLKENYKDYMTFV